MTNTVQMKILKCLLFFIILFIIGFGLYFYFNTYSKLIPAKIDSDIQNEKIFRIMDLQKEISNGTEIYDSIPRKKSSTVLFYADKKPKTAKELKLAGFNNCRALKRNGKIRVSIGYSSGFSGGGYDIDYLYGRFKLEPYSFTDVMPDKSSQPQYKILKQDVTFDKRFYNVGDSIYGKIDFVIENNNFSPKKYLFMGMVILEQKLKKNSY